MECAKCHNTCCCKKCSTCHNCYQQDEYRIRDLIYAIEQTLSRYYEALLCKNTWGYSCNNLGDFDIDKLMSYDTVLRRHLKAITKDFQPCLCPEELQLVVDGVLELVDLSCCKDTKRCDIVVDTSQFDDWALYNKYCIAYEVWERSIFRVCNEFSAVVTTIPDPQNLIYTLKVLQIATEQQCFDATIGSDYLDKISVEKLKSCDLSINEALLSKLKENHKNLISEIKCDFDFKVYASLIACNFTNEIIVNLVNCGFTVGYNVNTQNCELTHNNKVYPLRDMNINTNLSNCDPGFNLVDITDSYNNLEA